MSNRFSGEIPYGNRWLGYFVQHRTAANLLLVLMVLGGVYAGGQIRSQFFPDVVLETITVNVAWPGAGAEDVEAIKSAVKELEQAAHAFSKAMYESNEAGAESETAESATENAADDEAIDAEFEVKND